MMYQCTKCLKQFIHPAKDIMQVGSLEEYEKLKRGEVATNHKYETMVCPFCFNKEYAEAPTVTEDIESVYIYDLNSGPQTALDALLAQGYVIVNRYAKTYALERPKAKEASQ